MFGSREVDRRPDGRPASFDWSMRTTYDPTNDAIEFPYRMVFYGPCKREEILGDELEMFARAEEWKGFETMEFEKIEDMVIASMERTPQEVTRYIMKGRSQAAREKGTA